MRSFSGCRSRVQERGQTGASDFVLPQMSWGGPGSAALCHRARPPPASFLSCPRPAQGAHFPPPWPPADVVDFCLINIRTAAGAQQGLACSSRLCPGLGASGGSSGHARFVPAGVAPPAREVSPVSQIFLIFCLSACAERYLGLSEGFRLCSPGNQRGAGVATSAAEAPGGEEEEERVLRPRRASQPRCVLSWPAVPSDSPGSHGLKQ